jgi:hypothetical protein
MRFMATPLLVVVGAFLRKVRASPRRCWPARFRESLQEAAGAPAMRDGGKFIGAPLTVPECDTIFPHVCKNHHRGVGKGGGVAGVTRHDPFSKQGVVKTGMGVA